MVPKKPKVNSVDKLRLPKNQAIAEIVTRAIAEGRLRFSAHAFERMSERAITQLDIKDVLLDGRRERRKDQFDEQHGRWSYAWRGKLEDGRELRVPLTELEDGIIIITAIDLTHEND